ncbi:hypothetical protein D9M71_613780 [compost metagenome]
MSPATLRVMVYCRTLVPESSAAICAAVNTRTRSLWLATSVAVIVYGARSVAPYFTFSMSSSRNTAAAGAFLENHGTLMDAFSKKSSPMIAFSAPLLAISVASLKFGWTGTSGSGSPPAWNRLILTGVAGDCPADRPLRRM